MTEEQLDGIGFVRAGITRQRQRFDELLLLNKSAVTFKRDKAIQVNLGCLRFFADDWRAQMEVYYKDLDTTDFTLAVTPTALTGVAYGADFIVSKISTKGTLLGKDNLSGEAQRGITVDNTGKFIPTSDADDFGVPRFVAIGMRFGF